MMLFGVLDKAFLKDRHAAIECHFDLKPGTPKQHHSKKNYHSRHNYCSQLSYFSELVIRTRQRSGEGVVRRNGCPKGCFWRVRFFSAPLRFSLKTPERSRENLLGAEKKRTLRKHPFGQPFLRATPSPLLWRAPKLALQLQLQLQLQL